MVAPEKYTSVLDRDWDIQIIESKLEAMRDKGLQIIEKMVTENEDAAAHEAECAHECVERLHAFCNTLKIIMQVCFVMKMRVAS